MFTNLKNIFRKRRRNKNQIIDPDEIFVDSQNLPDFNTDQFEGRLEKPIARNVFNITTFFYLVFVASV